MQLKPSPRTSRHRKEDITMTTTLLLTKIEALTTILTFTFALMNEKSGMSVTIQIRASMHPNFYAKPGPALQALRLTLHAAVKDSQLASTSVLNVQQARDKAVRLR